MIRELIDENEDLKKQLADSRAQLASVQAEREQLFKKYQRLAHELALLQRQVFGRKSERVDEAQLQLALLPMLAAEAVFRSRERQRH